MVDVHTKEQDNKYRPRQKNKEDWIKEKRLILPKSWKSGDALHSLLSRKLNAAVVSHMTKRKIWGALHEETRYGKSHFRQLLNLEGMSPNILKQVLAMTEAEVNGDRDWIADESLRATLLQWAENMLEQRSSERQLPRYKDKELKEIVYQTPCMTTRKELSGELLSKLSKEWGPGTGTWVAEKSMHDKLYEWLAKNNLVGEPAKEIAAGLKRSPPRLPNKSGQPSTVGHQLWRR